MSRPLPIRSEPAFDPFWSQKPALGEVKSVSKISEKFERQNYGIVFVN